MPLSTPTSREPIHSRVVECTGYRRDDGLWDIEGHITDRKTYGYSSSERGEVKAGEPVHDMWLRLTLDDSMQVKAIEAVTDHSPYPASCPGIVPDYQKIVGLAIGPGWTRAVKQRVGGVHGCTHLTELLGPVATTAFQTIYPWLARQARQNPGPGGHGGPAAFPLLNTCHSFRADGPVIARIAPHLAGPVPEKPAK
jgi:hypothetical protein